MILALLYVAASVAATAAANAPKLVVTAVAPPMSKPEIAAAESLPTENARPLSLQDVISRVDNFEPLLRARSLDLLRAQIALRRAQWNRVYGTVGVSAQDTLSEGQLGPIPRSLGVTDASGAKVIDPATGKQLQQPINSYNTHQLAAYVDANVAFPIFAGGAIQGAIDAARAREHAADADFAQLKRDLRRIALMAYAQLIAARQQFDVASHALQRGQNIVDIAGRRRNSGLGTEADVARARLTLLSEQEDLEQRRGEEALAQAAVRAVLLLDAGTLVIPSDSMDDLARYQSGGPQLERPELRSLSHQVRAAEYDRKVAFAGYLPRLEIFADATYGNGSFITYAGVPQFTGQSNGYIGVFSGTLVAGARLNWTFFDFFITRDQVANAAVLRDQASARLADEQRTVERERDEAKAREEQSRRRVAALSGGGEVAATAVRLARARYESGNAILTEVLDAEIQAIGVEARQVQASYDFAVSHLDRLRADGGPL